MARVYATLSDYQDWVGDEAATVSASLLARASLLIDRALIGAVYDTDAEGLPTDTDVAAALRDATCAQLAWWDEIGDETGSGAAGQFVSAAIGSANYTRASGAKGSGKAISERLDATAMDVLNVAGLLPVSPYVHG